jgi:hypothetical protein
MELIDFQKPFIIVILRTFLLQESPSFSNLLFTQTAGDFDHGLLQWLPQFKQIFDVFLAEVIDGHSFLGERQ